ncbi:MAG TPA: AAA family ATPase [Pirellulaceae bacterium]|nr:AAA family ATPase [Pirellulaceae bacterium]
MSETPSSADEPLGQRLLRAAFPHPVETLELMETHISWVILTGPWAYKIKKPVRFDFLDYSTPAQRLHFCQRELELNRIWAGDLYQDVVAIIASSTGLRIAPLGEPIESDERVIDYAVRMKQFPQTALLAAQLVAGHVTSRDMETLADELADTHRRTPPIEQTPESAQAAAIRPTLDNFSFLLDKLLSDDTRQAVIRIRDWTRAQTAELGSTFSERATQGRVRQCHGDLHLNNLLYLEQEFLPFDGIEFNDQLSQIDVVNDIAFLAMELSEHQYRPHAYRFRNRYFEVTEDYAGLRLLPFYLVYRAMVRAKVDLIRQLQQSGGAQTNLSDAGRRYVQYAQYVMDRPEPELWITFGPSGSGKSTEALKFVEQQGFFRLRADVVRKRLAGRDPFDATPTHELSLMYGPDMTRRTYNRLGELAQLVLAAGYRVIVDATFLKVAQRMDFARLAETLGVTFRILVCEAPPRELERRLKARERDPSEATIDVLRNQLQSLEPLSEAELRHV